MKALILIAGKGTRLGALTQESPKPLLPIGGRPLLEWTIESLRRIGITEIVMNPCYLGNKIEEHFQDGRNFGVDIQYNREERLLGTAGAVRAAAPLLGRDPFLIIYGDNFITTDLRHIIKCHLYNRDYDATLGLWHTTSPRPGSRVIFNKNDRVIDFVEKPSVKTITYYKGTPNTWMWGGVMMMNYNMVRTIPDEMEVDFGHDVIPQWVRYDKSIGACLHSNGLIDIGTPEGYGIANEIATEWRRG